MLSINDLKKGTAIKFQGEPFIVISSQHLKMGRGGGIMQTKLKNLITGQVLEKNFKGQESLESADLERKKAQFLYADSEGAHFMDQTSYETLILAPENAQDQLPFLKEGAVVQLMFFENRPVSVEVPVKVDLKVVSTPPGAKGNTASGGATKTAKLETGAEVQVPMFVKEGDLIRVNTETGQYVERAS